MDNFLSTSGVFCFKFDVFSRLLLRRPDSITKADTQALHRILYATLRVLNKSLAAMAKNKAMTNATASTIKAKTKVWNFDAKAKAV